MVLSLLYDVGAVFLFTLEIYHFVGHVLILTGTRTLPRRDLVRQRFYFLVDTTTVFLSSFVLTGRMKWLAFIQILQHLYYFIAWDKSYMAKKIIDWSSLEWFNKDNKRTFEFDSFFGTLFDVIVHVCMLYAIFPLLDTTRIIVAVILTQIGLFAILFNPKFAWSNPNNIPEWVQRRIGQRALAKQDS